MPSEINIAYDEEIRLMEYIEIEEAEKWVNQ